jgi:hypothetical protein
LPGTPSGHSGMTVLAAEAHAVALNINIKNSFFIKET